MTSRGRILAAVEHREPDKVPVDLGSTPSSGISAIAYSRLSNQLGHTDMPVRVYDVIQELAVPDDWALDSFGIDVVDIGRTFDDKPSDWRDVELPDGWKVKYPRMYEPIRKADDLFFYDGEGDLIAQRPAGATFYDQRYFPYVDGYPSNYTDLSKAMGKVLWSALVHSPWNHSAEKGFWDDLRTRAIALKAKSDRALVIVAGCNLFEWGSFLRRMDNFLMDLACDTAEVERLLDALMEVHLSTLEKVCAAVGDVADIIRFGDDLGYDNGPFMSPETYRRFFKPRHTELVSYVKKHSSMKTFLHSCGSLYPIIPDLIDAGYDILNPVQTNARDMQPERLKNEFGRDICFWGGGIDTREVLNCGTPSEVKAQVKRRLEIFSRGGGYVFNTVHNILPDVPPENIIAMYEATAEFNGSAT
ncbi:MAG: methyltransferase [Spirochaetaceae bacterium]|nr:methyltransferase [Spirochaetaceae bacterium]